MKKWDALLVARAALQQYMSVEVVAVVNRTTAVTSIYSLVERCGSGCLFALAPDDRHTYRGRAMNNDTVTVSMTVSFTGIFRECEVGHYYQLEASVRVCRSLLAASFRVEANGVREMEFVSLHLFAKSTRTSKKLAFACFPRRVSRSLCNLLVPTLKEYRAHKVFDMFHDVFDPRYVRSIASRHHDIIRLACSLW